MKLLLFNFNSYYVIKKFCKCFLVEGKVKFWSKIGSCTLNRLHF